MELTCKGSKTTGGPPADLRVNLSAFHMDNYTSDEDVDNDFDTQLIIQQSLQDIHKPGTIQQAPDDESFLSTDYKKIVEIIETVKYSFLFSPLQLVLRCDGDNWQHFPFKFRKPRSRLSQMQSTVGSTADCQESDVAFPGRNYFSTT